MPPTDLFEVAEACDLGMGAALFSEAPFTAELAAGAGELTALIFLKFRRGPGPASRGPGAFHMQVPEDEQTLGSSRPV